MRLVDQGDSRSKEIKGDESIYQSLASTNFVRILQGVAFISSTGVTQPHRVNPQASQMS